MNQEGNKKRKINTKLGLKENKINPFIEKSVTEMAIEWPEYGKLRLSKKMETCGVLLSPELIQIILIRNNLNTTRKRIKVLEKMVKNGVKLNEAQLKALECYKEYTFIEWLCNLILFPGVF